MDPPYNNFFGHEEHGTRSPQCNVEQGDDVAANRQYYVAMGSGLETPNTAWSGQKRLDDVLLRDTHPGETEPHQKPPCQPDSLDMAASVPNNTDNTILALWNRLPLLAGHNSGPMRSNDILLRPNESASNESVSSLNWFLGASGTPSNILQTPSLVGSRTSSSYWHNSSTGLDGNSVSPQNRDMIPDTPLATQTAMPSSNFFPDVSMEVDIPSISIRRATENILANSQQPDIPLSTTASDEFRNCDGETSSVSSFNVDDTALSTISDVFENSWPQVSSGLLREDGTLLEPFTPEQSNQATAEPIHHAPLPQGSAVEFVNSSHSNLQVPQDRRRRISDPTPIGKDVLNNTPLLQRSASTRSSRPLVAATAPRPRGRRKGPLGPEQKQSARQARSDKTVCIFCNLKKRKCARDPDKYSSICDKCQNSSTPCVKMYFHYIVISVATSIVFAQGSVQDFHSALNHGQIVMPESIVKQQHIAAIRILAPKFDLRVLTISGREYIVKLDSYCSYVDKWGSDIEPNSPFLELLEALVGRRDDWKEFLRGTDNWQAQDLLGTLIHWGATADRASYALIYKADQRLLPLAPTLPDDKQLILACAQASFVILRRIELAAFEALQKQLIMSDPVTPELLRSLGALLFPLRWRISRHKLQHTLTGNMLTPTDTDAQIQNLKKLCHKLYFHYCFRYSMLPDSGAEPECQSNVYPEAPFGISETFPFDATKEGYHRWLLDGENKLSVAISGIRQ